MTMVEQKRGIPPYAPFYVLKSFLQHFAQYGVRDDEEVSFERMEGVSEGQQVHLWTTIKYLGLVTADKKPTALLHRMATNDEERLRAEFRRIVKKVYPFILDNDPDLSNLTRQQLNEYFTSIFRANGSTVRKCSSFFIEIAREAGWDMSNIEDDRRSTHNGQSSAVIVKAETNGQDRQDPDEWARTMLPKFDPNWSSEIQTAWFEAYTKLINK